jgi:hypothetical protein
MLYHFYLFYKNVTWSLSATSFWPKIGYLSDTNCETYAVWSSIVLFRFISWFTAPERIRRCEFHFNLVWKLTYFPLLNLQASSALNFFFKHKILRSYLIYFNVINIIRFHIKILLIVLVTSVVACLQSAMRILQKMAEAIWFLDYTGGQSFSAETYCFMKWINWFVSTHLLIYIHIPHTRMHVFVTKNCVLFGFIMTNTVVTSYMFIFL